VIIDRIDVPKLSFVSHHSPKWLSTTILEKVDDIVKLLSDPDRNRSVTEMTDQLNKTLPKLNGDPIIQIGTTVHLYGSRQVTRRWVFMS
jgi:hypothetical protein